MNRFVLAMALATSLFLANCSTGEWGSGRSPDHSGHLFNR
jgi:hypothetical protein